MYVQCRHSGLTACHWSAIREHGVERLRLSSVCVFTLPLRLAFQIFSQRSVRLLAMRGQTLQSAFCIRDRWCHVATISVIVMIPGVIEALGDLHWDVVAQKGLVGDPYGYFWGEVAGVRDRVDCSWWVEGTADWDTCLEGGSAVDGAVGVVDQLVCRVRTDQGRDRKGRGGRCWEIGIDELLR